MMCTSLSPASKPSAINGSITRYSSSLLVKNAHAWHGQDCSVEPMLTVLVVLFMALLFRWENDVRKPLISLNRLDYYVSCCLTPSAIVLNAEMAPISKR